MQLFAPSDVAMQHRLTQATLQCNILTQATLQCNIFSAGTLQGSSSDVPYGTRLDDPQQALDS